MMKTTLACKHTAQSLVLTLLLTLTALPAAQAEFNKDNLNTLLGAAKNLSKTYEVANLSEKDEIDIGKEVAARTLGSYRPVNDPQLERYLNQVGVWVALQSPRPNLPWRFAAVQSSEINAFAVPGGTILVTQGMLKLLGNEAELACVMGHEIGHVVNKHHLKLLQKNLLLKTGSDIVSSQANANAKELVGKGGDLFALSLDRGSEREADSEGVLFAARAGYDPAACLNFMQRMASVKQETNALAALYKTHPRASERIADIQTALRQLQGAQAGNGAKPQLGIKQ